MGTLKKLLIVIAVSFVLFLVAWHFMTAEREMQGGKEMPSAVQSTARPLGSPLPEAVPDPDELYRSTPVHPQAIPDPDELK